jgi:hypothetical protein
MTTITISEATHRNGGRYQVFGTYSGEDDRYVFGVRDFARKADAERAARAMVEEFAADHLERIKD